MQIVFLILLFIIGTCIGSFLCCQARRLHLKDTKEHPTLSKHSVCLHCGYQLKWYDNLPIVSWLILKGKCRKCGKRIGFAELLSELSTGLAFLVFGLGAQFSGDTLESLLVNTPLAWLSFIFALILISTLAFLAIYDGIYGQLPTLCLIIAIIFAVIIVVIREWINLSVVQDFLPSLGHDLADLLLATLILGGIYLVLYFISKGKWVGDGDWLLGTALALVLGTPWLAVITLFLANFLACLVMLPVMKRHKTHKIYFGPFMVAAFVVVFSFASFFNSLLSQI